MASSVTLSVLYRTSSKEPRDVYTVIEVEIKIPAGASEGEVLDTISRSACEAYRIAKEELESGR